MFDDHLEAAQRLGDVDRVRHEQVVVVAAKCLVVFALKHYNQIACICTRILITLASERNLLTVVHALVDRHLVHFLLLDCLLAVALFASVLLVDELTLAAAIATYRLHLLNHARTELLELHYKTAAFARRTRLGRACFATRSFAAFANNRSLEFD